VGQFASALKGTGFSPSVGPNYIGTLVPEGMLVFQTDPLLEVVDAHLLFPVAVSFSASDGGPRCPVSLAALVLDSPHSSPSQAMACVAFATAANAQSGAPAAMSASAQQSNVPTIKVTARRRCGCDRDGCEGQSGAWADAGGFYRQGRWEGAADPQLHEYGSEVVPSPEKLPPNTYSNQQPAAATARSTFCCWILPMPRRVPRSTVVLIDLIQANLI